jgi:hypothetical protein
MRSVLLCYKQDKSRIQSVVGQSQVDKNASRKQSHHAATGEDTADWDDRLRAVVNYRVWISDSVVVSCSYDL